MVYGQPAIRRAPYDMLVIATGSCAVHAADRRTAQTDTARCKDGVFVFRTLDDCDAHHRLVPGAKPRAR